MQKFSILLTTTMLSVGASVSVNAQSDESNSAIEEVLVTAQRRVTDAQTTAVAVTALSSQDLEAKSIDDVEDLGLLTPSMHVSLFQGEAQIYIRGIGYSGIIGGSDSSTALHQDGVYLSRSSAAVPAFFDVDRVEVVRGPQGTLYGRNATGGSLNVITKGATDEFSAETSMLVGDYSRYQVFGAVSGPIGDGRVRYRLAAQMEDQEGFTDLIRPDGSTLDVEDTSEWMLRGTLEFDASENVSVTLKGDYYEADDRNSVWLFFNPGTGTNPFFRQYLQDRGGELPTNPLDRRQDSDLTHFNTPIIYGATARVDWQLGDYTFTSLTGYKHTRPKNRNDLDATGAFGVDQLREEDHDQFSQEFQLSSPEGERFEWIVGFYYFEEENQVRNEYFLPFIDEQFELPSNDVCCLLQLNGFSETQAFAMFGEGTYRLTDTLDLVLGMRYSDESRDGNNAVRLLDFPTPVLDNVAQFDEASFDDFTPKVGLNYQVNEQVFLYGSVSQGFKAGGFNIGSYQNTPFDPEQITAYELGLKTDLADNRVRLNAAAFYYDYEDYQFQDVENNNTVIRNAAEADITGLEIEGIASLGGGFNLDFGVTWLDAEFSNFMAIDPKAPQLGVQDLDGNQMPRAPELKLALGLQYAMRAGAGELIWRADYAWQDDVYFSAFNVPQLFQQSYGWAKARVTWIADSGKWRISAFADNLTDEQVISNATFNGDIIDSTVTGNMAPPRTFGIEFNYQLGN